MATFHVELVSPERLLFSGEVEQVDVPGSEGDFGVLAGHAPLVTTLRPGILTIYGEGKVTPVVVNTGFAEVGQTGLTVLAEMAAPCHEFRLMAAGRMREVDLAVVAGAAQRVPFLALAAIFAAPGITNDLARNIVGEPVRDLAELLDGTDVGFLVKLA